MSTITLTVLRCPASVVSEQRQARGGELTLGRGADCDWQLADPDRVLSKKHCTVEFFGGGWQVRDLSKNGTIVNYGTPIGQDQVRPLLDGDRLTLGSYEIEVRISDEARFPTHPSEWDHALGSSGPLSQAGSASAPAIFGDLQPGAGASPFPPLPDDYEIEVAPDAPLADHTDSHAEVFIPRAIVPEDKPLIPDDWDHELGLGAELPPNSAGASRSDAASTKAESTHTEDSDLPAMPRRNPFDEPKTPSPKASLDMGSANQDSPRLPDASQEASAPVALSAFLAGAALPIEEAGRAAAHPEEALRRAGALLRAAISGLRALLIARSDIKREFRIEQTVLQLESNNPLKFAASEEQALASLLDPNVAALSAMHEALDDLKSHQLATLAATQAAARELLEQLAPEGIEVEDVGGGLLPGMREKRLWMAYQRRHAQLVEQLEDNFDSAFGKAFARVYEAMTGHAPD